MSRGPLHLLVITADFLRADFLSCQGHPRINSWYLDKLAREGCRFTACYAASPVTATARASLLTSTRPAEHQVLASGVPTPAGLPNLFSELAGAGYLMGLFGQPDGLPEGQVNTLFEETQMLTGGSRDDLPDFTGPLSSTRLPEGHPHMRAGCWTDAALGFLGRHTGSAAAAWLSFAEPGPPYAAPPPYDFLFALDEVELPHGWPTPANRHEPARHAVWRAHAQTNNCSEEDLRRLISLYMGQVRMIDDQIGRILRILTDTGRLEHTLLVFAGTHGDLLGHRGLAQNPPVFYDPAVRVPWLILDPRGTAKGQVFDGLVETLDIAPTVLGLLGVAPPASMVGRSWAKDLRSGHRIGHDQILSEGGTGSPTVKAPLPGYTPKLADGITLHGPGAMIRQDSWKLTVYSDDSGELYDLDSDPTELQNRFEDPSVIDVREELMGALARRLLGAKVRGGPPHREDIPDLRHAPPCGAAPAAGKRPAQPQPAQRTGRVEILRRRLAEELPTRRRITSAVKLTRAPFATAVRGRSLQQVLFVGTTNTFRSRFSEAFFNYFANILNLRWSACSRGLAVRASAMELAQVARDALKEREIPQDHTANVPQPLALDDLQRADRIIAVNEGEIRPLMLEQFPDWVERIEYWDIPDIAAAPGYQSLSRMEELATRLIRELDSPTR